MNYLKKRSLLLLFFALIFCAAHANAAYINSNTYEDTQTFNPDWLYSGTAGWWHTIPADFNPVSAEISLELQVAQYSEIGVLHLFSSNTNEFDYESPYTASSKPGFIASLYSVVPPIFVEPGWHTVTFDLSIDQLNWLGDDGEINMALIGNQYLFPIGFPAKFYLKSATITANAVPIPSSFLLLGFGLGYLIKIKHKFQS